MQIENRFITVRHIDAVEGVMTSQGEQGFHLVSSVLHAGQWYLSFSNWATLLNVEQDKRKVVEEPAPAV
jgi:hypothetical protein